MSAEFEYTLRRSARARNVRLKVTPRDGLVVVVPKRYPAKRIPALLTARRDWIESALARVAPRREHLAGHDPRDRPRELELQGIGEKWVVEYRPTTASRISVASHDDMRLVIFGPVDDAAACRAATKRWLARTARDRLVTRLWSIADEHGFQVNATSVRWQRTRWGSCSSRGNISINAKLLFLPRQLVDHVLLHELCHTVQLDHSSAFWSLFERYEPGCRAVRRDLRDAWRYVPPWIEADI